MFALLGQLLPPNGAPISREVLLLFWGMVALICIMLLILPVLGFKELNEEEKKRRKAISLGILALSLSISVYLFLKDS
jgi:predicted nucleic acid-binding Zn ribbon protein